LSPAAARELEPGLRPTIAGAVHYPDEAHCDPRAFVTALIDAARDLGADVQTSTEVLRFHRTTGRIARLETADGTTNVGSLVLAAGTWSRQLARQLGLHLPLEGAKGYHVEVDAGPPRLGLPIYMEESRVIATPIGNRLRFAGTLELSGIDMTVDPVRVAALPRAARRSLTLPAELASARTWSGLRPCTPDGLPIIGTADGVDNMVLATGHAMLGITLAPATGEIVAELISGEPCSYDLDAFAPGRFRSLLRPHRTARR
jgi:D-amino-acid dehydrogenase